MKLLHGLFSLAFGLSLMFIIAASSNALAQGGSCDDLWYRRNAEYKQAGYCFHTARGIRAFGNAGCQFDNVEEVPLSPQSQRIVADILAQERAYGCR